MGAHDRSGQLVRGRYRLDALLATGGQSSVYRGLDLVDGDGVAIKVLHAHAARDRDWVERMFREARAMASLVRTAAVRVLDQAWTDDGCPCLVLELLDGRDLDDHLSALEARGESMGAAELHALLTPIVETLELAHAQGIVHRDLKPPNIFVVDAHKGGGVRLLDFGFVKFTRSRAMTELGQVAGSPSYIAPEAWSGNSALLDHRVDVYGYAAIVFRALTGRPPFQSANLFELATLVTSAPRPGLTSYRRDLPSEADDWARQALAISPDERFSSVRAAHFALGQVLGL